MLSHGVSIYSHFNLLFRRFDRFRAEELTHNGDPETQLLAVPPAPSRFRSNGEKRRFQDGHTSPLRERATPIPFERTCQYCGLYKR